MARKNSKHDRSRARHLVTVWGFLLLAIVAGFIGIQGYIGNSKESKKRYNTLLSVDAAGGDVEQALLELRSFIYAHMNTTIGSPTGVRPPIQLKGTYDRLVAAEKARVAQANDDLYNKAQKDCERRFPNGLSGSNRIPCITEYVTQNPAKENTIPEGQYKYDFVAPLWSPDRAGFGLLFAGIFGAAYMFQFITYAIAKAQSKQSS